MLPESKLTLSLQEISVILLPVKFLPLSHQNYLKGFDLLYKIILYHLHIHLLVSVPPHLSSSELVHYIKGNTSRKLQMEYKELNKQFWGQHLWARGYFVASSGNVTDEIIKEYIKNQDIQEKSNSDNFEIG